MLRLPQDLCTPALSPAAAAAAPGGPLGEDGHQGCAAGTQLLGHVDQRLCGGDTLVQAVQLA